MIDFHTAIEQKQTTFEIRRIRHNLFLSMWNWLTILTPEMNNAFINNVGSLSLLEYIALKNAVDFWGISDIIEYLNRIDTSNYHVSEQVLTFKKFKDVIGIDRYNYGRMEQIQLYDEEKKTYYFHKVHVFECRKRKRE